MEAYDTTKTWSTFIAKQIDIQNAVMKATQLGVHKHYHPHSQVKEENRGGSKTRNSIGIAGHRLQTSNT